MSYLKIIVLELEKILVVQLTHFIEEQTEAQMRGSDLLKVM